MLKFKAGKYSIKIKNQDKILFSKNITKIDLINYYNYIAPKMLKYTKDRPLMMRRYPNGITGKSFYQKNSSVYFPKWIKTFKVPLKSSEKKSYNNYVICNNKATLIYLANQAVIEYHIWLSNIKNLNYPNKLIFDLDPGTKDFEPLRKCALLLKELLESLNLIPFLMTTGSKGLHVVVPIKQKLTFIEVKKFADKCAQKIIKLNPKLFTQDIRKDRRDKRLFIDTLRNQYGATSVAPYSTRAIINAPIATPLDWKEIHEKDLYSQKYNIKNISERLEKIKDPWENFSKSEKILITKEDF